MSLGVSFVGLVRQSLALGEGVNRGWVDDADGVPLLEQEGGQRLPIGAGGLPGTLWVRRGRGWHRYL